MPDHVAASGIIGWCSASCDLPLSRALEQSARSAIEGADTVRVERFGIYSPPRTAPPTKLHALLTDTTVVGGQSSKHLLLQGSRSHVVVEGVDVSCVVSVGLVTQTLHIINCARSSDVCVVVHGFARNVNIVCPLNMQGTLELRIFSRSSPVITASGYELPVGTGSRARIRLLPPRLWWEGVAEDLVGSGVGAAVGACSAVDSAHVACGWPEGDVERAATLPCVDDPRPSLMMACAEGLLAAPESASLPPYVHAPHAVLRRRGRDAAPPQTKPWMHALKAMLECIGSTSLKEGSVKPVTFSEAVRVHDLEWSAGTCTPVFVCFVKSHHSLTA